MSAIYVFLERFGANTAHDVDKAFGIAVALLQIDLDQFFNDVRHLIL
jgi:hypothetical protein